MPSGIYDRIKSKPNTGQFKKGQHPSPSTEFKKGHHSSNGFKKGNIAWNKGIKRPEFSGKNHPNWKDGKWRNKGYVYILKQNHPFCNINGYILEHRFVIEQQIGRYLLTSEKCHHINSIKDDNRPQNLMAFINNSAHRRFHINPITVKPEEIIFDGRKLNK